MDLGGLVFMQTFYQKPLRIGTERSQGGLSLRLLLCDFEGWARKKLLTAEGAEDGHRDRGEGQGLVLKDQLEAGGISLRALRGCFADSAV